jgi:hypothetical protein
MRPTPLRQGLVVACALAVCTAACTGKDPYRPGTPLGTFHVDGKLLATSCGAASAPDPWSFDVKLAREGTTLYWLQGGLPVAGPLDANAHVVLASSDTQTVHAAAPRAGATPAIPLCAVTRADGLDATLAPDPATASGVVGFHGTLTYTFSATADSDCSDQLESAGGPFARLPCSVGYALAGVRSATP